jgi:hypothetical protein
MFKRAEIAFIRTQEHFNHESLDPSRVGSQSQGAGHRGPCLYRRAIQACQFRRYLRMRESCGWAIVGPGCKLRCRGRRAGRDQRPGGIRVWRLVASGTGSAQGSHVAFFRPLAVPCRRAGTAGNAGHGQTDRRLAGGRPARRHRQHSLVR